ncbi:MAG: N-acetylglucosamine-6-phosphate deacetylase [Fusicatenibacter sp.]|nr:N-acetylglucosamine-6-phosphate deacetylase [Fusicatenibacter sp.]
MEGERKSGKECRMNRKKDMRIVNGLVYRTSGFEREELYINRDHICSEKEYRKNIQEEKKEDEVIDAEGMYVVPGLVDVHFHGCAGYDFCDGEIEAMEQIASYEVRNGITTIVPATMTLSTEMLQRIFNAANRFAEEQEKKWKENPGEAAEQSYFAGIHMEGPYISEKKKGAQNASYLHLPERDHFDELNKISGNRIKIVSLAPELEGAEKFIREESGNVVISVAHTTADYETARAAFEAGASHVTHTYNAMPPFTHRAPGVIGAAFDKKDAMVELISDGIHIHPAVIRATVSMFGTERVVFVSDSMMGTGLKDGIYQLGGQDVIKRGSLAALQDGTIAGSVTNLYDCMCNAVRFGVPIADAVRFASENAALSAGLGAEYGHLREGAWADILLIDQKMKLKKIIHRGIILKSSWK